MPRLGRFDFLQNLAVIQAILGYTPRVPVYSHQFRLGGYAEESMDVAAHAVEELLVAFRDGAGVEGASGTAHPAPRCTRRGGPEESIARTVVLGPHEVVERRVHGG